MHRLLVLTAMTSLFPTEAAACGCAPLSPAAAFRQADAVVLVQVKSSKDIGEYRRVYAVDVKRQWKGRPLDSDRIATRRTGCMLDLAPGGMYLVYVRQPRGGMAEGSGCSGSLPVAGAEKAMDWLNRNTTSPN